MDPGRDPVRQRSPIAKSLYPLFASKTPGRFTQYKCYYFAKKRKNMDPDNFRKRRIEIKRLCEEIAILSEENDADSSNKKITLARSLLEELADQADGEIQKRSVENLGTKIKVSSLLIDKIKPAGRSKKTTKTVSSADIDWDQDRLRFLSVNFLLKLIENMGSDAESRVCLSTKGKGVKPSYQIDFGKGRLVNFSGSAHKPLKGKLSGSQTAISKPFTLTEIRSILEEKQ